MLRPVEDRPGWVQFTPKPNTIAQFDIRIRLPRTDAEYNQLKDALATAAGIAEMSAKKWKEASVD